MITSLFYCKKTGSADLYILSSQGIPPYFNSCLIRDYIVPSCLQIFKHMQHTEPISSVTGCSQQTHFCLDVLRKLQTTAGFYTWRHREG